MSNSDIQYNNLGSFRHMSANSMNLKPYIFKMELAMQGYIVEHPNILSFEDEDAKYINPRTIDNEVTVKYKEKIDNKKTGRIDLLAEYSYKDENDNDKKNLGIIELKRVMLDDSHFTQLENYIKQIYEHQDNDDSQDNGDLKKEIDSYEEVLAILCGPSICPKMATEIIEGKTIEIGDYPPIKVGALVLNRFRGDDGSIYVITDVYKPKKMGNRYDYSNIEVGDTIYFNMDKLENNSNDICKKRIEPNKIPKQIEATVVENNKIKFKNIEGYPDPYTLTDAVKKILGYEKINKYGKRVNATYQGPKYWSKTPNGDPLK